MRNLSLALLAVFVAAPALSATEALPMDDLRTELAPAVVAEVEAVPDAGIHLTEIQIEERAAPADDAAAAQLGPRGSFWWVVGVIVVAGVILALVL